VAAGDRSRGDRGAEWFVPRFGSPRFRTAVGLLFLPYTGMVISFSTIGGMFAHSVHWDRVAAGAIIYLLGLGVGAHALDALGSKENKPWGEHFTKRQLWIAAALSLGSAYLIAVYYIVRFVPSLSIIAVLEGFFVFAYNLEWFKGRFHTDTWFAFSWGFLPAAAGYVIQTNTISSAVLLVSVSMALFSLVEIKASRPYKELKKRRDRLEEAERATMLRYETILKSISLGVITLGLGLILFRLSLASSAP
jgi:hypothetical protein